MAAEVGSAMRVLRGHMEDQVVRKKMKMIDPEMGQSEPLVTRDLLGTWPSRVGSMELKRCRSPNVPISSTSDYSKEMKCPKVQDLNFLPPMGSTSIPADQDSSLELELFPSGQYQCVCTLDKVKFALEKAQKQAEDRKSSLISKSQKEEEIKETRNGGEVGGKGSSLLLTSSSTSSSSSSDTSPPTSSSFAAACPSCLLYVLTWTSNPLCPNCHSVVPFPRYPKKPRIDLNSMLPYD